MRSCTRLSMISPRVHSTMEVGTLLNTNQSAPDSHYEDTIMRDCNACRHSAASNGMAPLLPSLCSGFSIQEPIPKQEVPTPVISPRKLACSTCGRRAQYTNYQKRTITSYPHRQPTHSHLFYVPHTQRRCLRHWKPSTATKKAVNRPAHTTANPLSSKPARLNFPGTRERC